MIRQRNKSENFANIELSFMKEINLGVIENRKNTISLPKLQLKTPSIKRTKSIMKGNNTSRDLSKNAKIYPRRAGKSLLFSDETLNSLDRTLQSNLDGTLQTSLDQGNSHISTQRSIPNKRDVSSIYLNNHPPQPKKIIHEVLKKRFSFNKISPANEEANFDGKSEDDSEEEEYEFDYQSTQEKDIGSPPPNNVVASKNLSPKNILKKSPGISNLHENRRSIIYMPSLKSIGSVRNSIKENSLIRKGPQSNRGSVAFRTSVALSSISRLMKKNSTFEVNQLEEMEISEENFEVVNDIANRLEKMERKLINSQKEEIVEELQNICTLSASINNVGYHINALETTSRVCKEVGDLRRSIVTLKLLKNISIFANRPRTKMKAYKWLAITYRTLEEHDKAFVILKKMLKLSWKLDDAAGELMTYDLLGLQYFHLGNLDRARYFHERMLQGLIEEKDSITRLIGVQSIDLKRNNKMNLYMNKLTIDSFQIAENNAKKTGISFPNTNLMHGNSGEIEQNLHIQQIFTDSEDDFDFDLLTKSETKHEVTFKELLKKGPPQRKHLEISNSEPHSIQPKTFLGPIFKTKGEPFYRRKRIDTGRDNLAFNSNAHNVIIDKLNISHLSPNRDLKNYCENPQNNLNSKFFSNFEDEFTVQLGPRSPSNYNIGMMIRKPTKIELKPEDDFHEYEEYKKKQSDASKTRIDQRGQYPKGSHEKMIPESINYYKNTGISDQQARPSSQVTPQMNNSPVYDTIINFQRSLQSSEILDFPPNPNPRGKPSHINQLFSMLLNNLSARGGAGPNISGASQQPGSSMNLEGSGTQQGPRGNMNSFM